MTVRGWRSSILFLDDEDLLVCGFRPGLGNATGCWRIADLYHLHMTDDISSTKYTKILLSYRMRFFPFVMPKTLYFRKKRERQ